MLEVRDMHAYYGSAHILAGVSLHIEKGEIVALVGRNGAGKTTTLKSIMGIVVPKKGSVRYKGREITGLKTFHIARMGIAYVPEDRRVYADFTVRENLEVAFRESGGKTGWGYSEVFALFPALKMLRGRLGHQLSGGEAQMLTIARALVTNPELLLLDEASEGLAPLVVASLTEAIGEMRDQGLSILVSEQNSRFAAKVADRIYILDSAKVVFEGSCAEFAQDEEMARRYLLV